ncbi:DUF1413 domain-containing protein [Thalassospira mesophila]|uniref:DUF1413 domain-containing protein n=1 Tax=Thalassospira mesophila TaxID=1293891 RepID=A0A1Y2L2V4_9PROT|nr:DUF1413 domain-containing protein [Thalassospira mesophila]OSQ39806.1 hypothetical protein TMES_07680 [Thalassospira mesophila]
MTDEEIARLRHQLTHLPAGNFHFPEIYGPTWDQLYIGDKVKSGHAFMNAVRAGKFPGIIDTGIKKGGGRVYQKIENP